MIIILNGSIKNTVVATVFKNGESYTTTVEFDETVDEKQQMVVSLAKALNLEETVQYKEPMEVVEEETDDSQI